MRTIQRFENGIGVSVKTFIKIVTDGFYYIDNKRKEIYWCNNAVSIGNGFSPHSNNMVRTHFLDGKTDYRNNKILSGALSYIVAKKMKLKTIPVISLENVELTV